MIELFIHFLRLSAEQLQIRQNIINELDLCEEDILAEINKMDEEDIDTIKETAWSQLRHSAHELQMICVSHYGQMGVVRGTLLSQKLRNLVQGASMQSKTKWRVFSEVGHAALRELGLFFSFRRAAILVNEAGQWNIAARWAFQQPNINYKPLAAEINLLTNGQDVPTPEETQDLVGKLWPNLTNQSYSFWMRVDGQTLYLFYDRRHTNNNTRNRFNGFSQHLLVEATLTFQQELMSRLSVYRRIESIRDIIHNLGGPMSELGSALTDFDISVYHKHLDEMNSLPANYDFLKQATDELYSDIERARRRIAFEVRKFQGGIDINRHLKKQTKKIPVMDSNEDPGMGPKGFWDKLMWSFDMHSRDILARSIEFIPIKPKKKSWQNMFIKVNRDAIRIVLDNIVDNSVKYSYNGKKIFVEMQHENIEDIHYCNLQISNYGNGILPSEMNKVFQRFYRGICSTTSRHEVTGTGLGLFIARKVIESYNGKVNIESRYGQEFNIKRGEGFNTIVRISLPVYYKKGR